MSQPHEAIFGKLSHTVAVTTYCSTRIYPNFVPQNVKLPAISYLRTFDRTEHAMGRDPSVYASGFQLDIYSTDLNQLMTISARVRNALRDYSGSTWAYIQRVYFEGQNEMEEYDPESKLVTQRAIQNYIIWWNT